MFLYAIIHFCKKYETRSSPKSVYRTVYDITGNRKYSYDTNDNLDVAVQIHVHFSKVNGIEITNRITSISVKFDTKGSHYSPGVTMLRLVCAEIRCCFFGLFLSFS